MVFSIRFSGILQLLDTYIMSSRDISLNTAACRLLQNIVPGLDTAVVFEEKVLFTFIPIRSYRVKEKVGKRFIHGAKEDIINNLSAY